MAGTLIVAVRAALIAGLGTLPEYTDEDTEGHTPNLSMAWPLGVKDAERVYTQSASFTHVPASLKAGRTFRNETGTFEVVIRVEGIDRTQVDTSGRAVELGRVFEEYVADNRTLGGLAGLNWVVVSGDGELVEMFNEQGTLAVLTYPIKYDARLT